MCAQAATQFDDCDACGKEFKQIETSDPRKGYDVVQEDADGWTVECKGCGKTHVIEKS